MRIRSRLLACTLPCLAALSGVFSASCASGHVASAKNERTAPEPATSFEAGSRTQTDYGIARWEVYEGSDASGTTGEQLVMSGLDRSGRSVKGLSVTAVKVDPEYQVTFEMLDGTEAAVVFQTSVTAGVPGSLIGTVTRSQALFFAHALVDLQSAMAARGTTAMGLRPGFASGGLRAQDAPPDCESGNDLAATIVFGLYGCTPITDFTGLVEWGLGEIVGSQVGGPESADCLAGLQALAESVQCPNSYGTGPSSCPSGQHIQTDNYGNTTCVQGTLYLSCRPTPSEPCDGMNGHGGATGGAAGSGGNGGAGASSGAGGSAGSGQIYDCPGGPGCPGGPPPDAGSGGNGNDGVGSGGAGGSGGSGYSFVEPRTHERHRAYTLAEGASTVIPFAWHDKPGIAPPADLSVSVGGNTLFQIAASAGQPFARAGLELVTLERDTDYRLVLSRSGASVEVKLLRANAEGQKDDGPTLLDARLDAGGGGGDDAPTIDVVLPGAHWRASIESDALLD